MKNRWLILDVLLLLVSLAPELVEISAYVSGVVEPDGAGLLALGLLVYLGVLVPSIIQHLRPPVFGGLRWFTLREFVLGVLGFFSVLRLGTVAQSLSGWHPPELPPPPQISISTAVLSAVSAVACLFLCVKYYRIVDRRKDAAREKRKKR